MSRLFHYIKKIIRIKSKNFVFGDSHARVFKFINKSRDVKLTFEVLTVGGATAQGLVNPRSKTNALNLYRQKIDLDCKKDDKLFFFLGEVDCGFVIWYRAKKYNESVNVQFERSLNNYESFLIKLRERGFKNINIIETVLPTIFDGFEGQIAHERKEVSASIKERTELTNLYNNRLKDIAERNQFGFVEITSDILDEKTGLVKKNLLNEDRTDHHLSNAKFAPIIYKNILDVLEKQKEANYSL